ncbi:MAG TPA: TRAP transporter substrate-binding protein DctP [Bacteroidota bacterium]|jgi:TRAP-type C4-dicarboxylate transport system substrate-binding protein|nr:TRAP transporter substrate-binding protein DctP [Bacteroidota bacterium]
MKRKIFLSLFLVLVLPLFAYSQQYTIKFASISPEGTTWMNVMHEYDAAVRKESNGRLGFKMYPGMTQGDEKTVVRKIAIGQLHAAGFTGVGLGEIAPKIRILDTPFLVRNSAEIDNLYTVLEDDFRAAFEENGYVVLGLVEIGFVYIFSNSPIQKLEDVQKVKMWVWEGDPVAETAFTSMNIKPIPLSIDNVRTSLQTGLVNAFYTTPYACISLQWFSQTKYMVDFPLTCSNGAVVISKKYFDNLPSDLQEILIRNGKKYMAQLTTLGRKDNENSLVELKKRGIIFTKVDEKNAKEYMETGARARKLLVGKLYDEAFLNKVESTLEQYRKKNK